MNVIPLRPDNRGMSVTHAPEADWFYFNIRVTKSDGSPAIVINKCFPDSVAAAQYGADLGNDPHAKVLVRLAS